ncbi:hypothetical protein N7495_002148 [Penicillium taxi]|nr:hypothetical protein N7495_002148 [Penicillium taxi]
MVVTDLLFVQMGTALFVISISVPNI